MKKLPLFEAIATLVGTIIGAGILGIPYVFSRSGFWTGTAMLVIVGLAMLLMKLMFGEVTLRTQGKHQLSGYAEIYLGKLAKHMMSFVLIFSIYGALLAYFIGEGQALSAVFGGPALLYSLIFYVIFAWLIFRGLNIIKRSELILSSAILLIIIIVAVFSWQHIAWDNLSGFDFQSMFYPYGVLLFACSGVVAIPQIRRVLLRREKLMSKAIWWGCIMPPIIYLIFAALVVGVTGDKTTQVATVGLGSALGPKMIYLGNLFAFFAMATSFLTLGLALKNVFRLDYKVKHVWAWLLSVSLPLVIFFLGAKNFINVINVVGALGVGLNGILYVFIYWVARKKGVRKPEYKIPVGLGVVIGVFLMAVFVGGIIYTLQDLM